MKRVWRCWVLLAAIALLCTGCSLDVESFLQPPRSRGEQQQVQQALETYIRDRGTAERYTLKYPAEGAHTAAFVLCDGQGRPVEDSSAGAQMAVAFYALASAPEETHINLLRRDGEEWVSVSDASGSGADIRQVAFGDLDGDGMAELLAGWSTYNRLEHRLAVYDIHSTLTPLGEERLYTGLYVGDVTATGQESLVLLRVSGGERVSASLESLRDGALHTVDTVRLDGAIQRFGSMTLCRLAQGVHGLYVEGYRGDNTQVTELIYYDDTGLQAPFYDKKTNATAVTHRSNGLIARDVDGDGQVDIPHSRLLSDEAATGLTDYLTLWRTWDYATATWTDRLSTVVNTADNYLVVLDKDSQEGLHTRYDPDSRRLDLLDGSGQVWLRLCAGEPGESPREGMESLTLWEKPPCIAWFDPLLLEAEKVRYMVVRLAGTD